MKALCDNQLPWQRPCFAFFKIVIQKNNEIEVASVEGLGTSVTAMSASRCPAALL